MTQIRRDLQISTALVTKFLCTGHQVTALYEITPIGSSAQLTSLLRYGKRRDTTIPGEIGFVALRWVIGDGMRPLTWPTMRGCRSI